MWTEIHKPKNSSEIVQHTQEAEHIKHLIKNKYPALIHGPTGTGKTSSIYAIANELGHEVIEINASCIRNKEKIKTIIGSASKQSSLFNKKRIILIDEIDCLSGRKDRGAIPELSKVLEASAHPIIFTAFNPYDLKLRPIRKKTTLVEFKPIETNQITKKLKEICQKENIKYKEETLKSIARKSGNDLRAAINDLQSLRQKDKISEKVIENERDTKKEIDSCLRLIFKSNTCKNVINSIQQTDMKLDEAFLWIDENLPREYSGRDLKEAYNAISKADVYKGRIRRWQHWRFLIYINALLTAGISTAKSKKPSQNTYYKPTTRILKLWRAKNKNLKKKAIAEKISSATHCSIKKTIKETMPYLKLIHKQNPKTLKEEIDLEQDEIKFIEEVL